MHQVLRRQDHHARPVAVLISTVVALACTACGTDHGGGGQSVSSLRQGQCFTGSISGGTFGVAKATTCDQPHFGEVVGKPQLAAGSDDAANRACNQSFSATPASGNAGLHKGFIKNSDFAACVAYSDAADKIIGSLGDGDGA